MQYFIKIFIFTFIFFFYQNIFYAILIPIPTFKLFAKFGNAAAWLADEFRHQGDVPDKCQSSVGHLIKMTTHFFFLPKSAEGSKSPKAAAWLALKLLLLLLLALLPDRLPRSPLAAASLDGGSMIDA